MSNDGLHTQKSGQYLNKSSLPGLRTDVKQNIKGARLRNWIVGPY